jgi:hypothetical protein
MEVSRLDWRPAAGSELRISDSLAEASRRIDFLPGRKYLCGIWSMNEEH